MTKKNSVPKKAIKHLKKNWIKYGFETFVVIVGILIAFALSNWNENRLQRKLEMQYLKRLVIDLKADSVYYEGRVKRSENEIKINREVIIGMYQSQNSLDEVKDLFNKIGWDTEQLTTQNVTYIEMTNSGQLDIIVNQDLKEAIIQYYMRNEEASKHVSEFNEVSTRFLINAGVSANDMRFYKYNDDIYFDTNYITNEDWSFMNDPTSVKFKALEQALAVYKAKNQEFIEQHFKPLKELASQLIKKVQNELDSRN